MKHCLIIQPHSDDALFSAASIILGGEYSAEILTVENDPKRIPEDEKLYEFLGIKYSHFDLDFSDHSFKSFHKTYDEVNETNAVEHLTNYFGSEVLSSIKNAIITRLRKYIKEHPKSLIFIPWGVGHPMHYFVRICAEEVVDASMLRYYRDFPHSYKKRAKSQIQKQLQDFELWRQVDMSEIHDVKWQLAQKFYRSQSGLMWFEQGYIRKRLPEEFYIVSNAKRG